MEHAKLKHEEGKKEAKVIHAIGKRKRAIARAYIYPGNGRVFVNSYSLEVLSNPMARLKIEEPLILQGDGWKKYDIHVNVRGGGLVGQAEASRQAIARCLVQIFGPDLAKVYLNYDRNLLVYDVRRTEPHKPPRSSQGPRRYKQRSKR